MTPTEQDKEIVLSHLKDVRAVLKWCYDHGLLKGEFPSDGSDKAYLLEQGEKRLMQLITADRERVALEARIDELENRLRVQFIPSHWARLCAEVNSWAKYVDRRIAELKAQQEEV